MPHEKHGTVNKQHAKYENEKIWQFYISIFHGWQIFKLWATHDCLKRNLYKHELVVVVAIVVVAVDVVGKTWQRILFSSKLENINKQ